MLEAKQRIARRVFLRGSAAGLGALAAPAVFADARAVLGASDTLVMGIIGAGGRGRNVMKKHIDCGARFAAVCDVFRPNLEAGIREAGGKADGCADYREVLDRKDVDAVLIATPEHWHGPMLIDAVNAGKDAYCEKPMSHSIEEGVRMVKAVRESDRIVQIGMQRRSSPAVLEAKELLKECGKVYHVCAYWNWRWSRPLSNAPLGGELDWKRFLGPAPEREFQPMFYRYWRYFWDFSGGNCTDQGTHLLDVVQWFMGSGAPRAATCHGSVFEMLGSETPDIFSAVFEYEGFLATWTLDYTNAMDNGWNIQFLGTEGTLWLDNSGARLFQSDAKGTTFNRTEKPHVVKEVTRPLSDEEHIKNFIECAKSRKEPSAPVEVGHLAVAGPHLANVALRRKARAQLDKEATEVTV
jgi:predicted dehydrogenase